jgi:hypothetical protein
LPCGAILVRLGVGFIVGISKNSRDRLLPRAPIGGNAANRDGFASTSLESEKMSTQRPQIACRQCGLAMIVPSTESGKQPVCPKCGAAVPSPAKAPGASAAKPAKATPPQTPDFDPYHRWLGIPAKDQPATYYRLLGLEAGEADPEVIRDAAEQRMAHVRTYQLGQYAPLSQRILNEIGRAKGCLLNPLEKQKYDAQLRQTRDARGPAPAAASTTPPTLPQRPRLMPRPPLARRQPAAGNRKRLNRYVWRAASGAAVLAVVGALVALSEQRDRAKTIAESPNPRAATVETNRREPVAVAPPVAKSKPNGPSKPSPIADEREPRQPAVDAPADDQPPRGKAPSANAASPSLPDAPLEMRQQPVAKPPVPSATTRAATSPPDESPRAASDRVEPSIGLNDADNGETPAPIRIALPSGAILTQMMLDVPSNWQSALFPDDAIVYVAHYPNNTIQGVFSLKNAKLDGAAATLYENGRLRSLAFYANANRHGPLKQWNDAGERLVYMDFKNGRKHGMVCLFQAGVPWLIQEFDRGNRQSEHLVRTVNGALRVLTEAEMNGETKADREKAAEQLLALEAKLKESETKLRSEMADWYRKEDQRLKRERFSELAPARHEAAMRRIEEHSASSGIGAMWQSALRRSGL